MADKSDLPQVTKKDVQAARYEEELKAIKRRARIDALNDWVEVVVAKIFGLGGAALGGLEYLDPNLLPIVLTRPGLIFSAGLALLLGKNFVSLIAKLDQLYRR